MLARILSSLSLLAGLSLSAAAVAQARVYAPEDPIFAGMTGSPAAPGDGMAVNPRTGQLEQVYATYRFGDPDTAGPMQETGRYFASDGPLPRGALSLAGYAPGYYSDRSSIFDTPR